MDFGVILEVENALKIDQKSIQKVIQHKMPDKRDFWSFLGGSWGDFGVVLGSKCAQEGSKRGLRGSKMGSRGSQKKDSHLSFSRICDKRPPRGGQGRFLRGLGGFLRVSWADFGGSWRGLGGSWRGLVGILGGVLGTFSDIFDMSKLISNQ